MSLINTQGMTDANKTEVHQRVQEPGSAGSHFHALTAVFEKRGSTTTKRILLSTVFSFKAGLRSDGP
jgi:hypothetical protein